MVKIYLLMDPLVILSDPYIFNYSFLIYFRLFYIVYYIYLSLSSRSEERRERHKGSLQSARLS